METGVGLTNAQNLKSVVNYSYGCPTPLYSRTFTLLVEEKDFIILLIFFLHAKQSLAVNRYSKKS
ncbi:20523_t:CDS:2 [Dentiscutata erythropus]|uniref:20523_t:CDS:1 n=1 Tax=Dentiscutata erythropus TaxID=1348616 RepID=A0A9N9A7A1_9GLOM|nr:20523_t:CDS:2 [Dentiscutata erythropus]